MFDDGTCTAYYSCPSVLPIAAGTLGQPLPIGVYGTLPCERRDDDVAAKNCVLDGETTGWTSVKRILEGSLKEITKTHLRN